MEKMVKKYCMIFKRTNKVGFVLPFLPNNIACPEMTLVFEGQKM